MDALYQLSPSSPGQNHMDRGYEIHFLTVLTISMEGVLVFNGAPPPKPRENGSPENNGDVFDHFEGDQTSASFGTSKIKSIAQIRENTFSGALICLFRDLNLLVLYHWSYWVLQWGLPVLDLLLLLVCPYLRECWSAEDNIGSVVRTFGFVLSLSPETYDTESSVTGSLVFSLIYVLFLVVFLGNLFYYTKTKRYEKPFLWILAVVLHGLVPSLLIPFAVHISLFLGTFVDGFQAGYAILAFIFLVVLGFSVGFLMFTSRFNRFLTHPTPSPFATYDGEHGALAIVVCGVTIILTGIGRLYADWLIGLFLILNGAVCGYLIFDVYQFRFVTEIANPAAAALYTGLIVSDVLNGIVCFGTDISSVVRIIAPFCVFIIAFIGHFLIFKKIIGGVLGILSNREAPSDSKRRAYFEDLGLENPRMVDRMIRIGMTHFPPMMIDFTFPIYAAEISTSSEALIDSALFVSFFPMEYQIVEFFLELLSKHPITGIVERYAIFRIWSLLRQRVSTQGDDSAEFLQGAKKLTNTFIRAVRSFWLRVATDPGSVDLSSLEQVEVLRSQAKSMWRIGCTRHRSDPQFSLGYSEYLLEGVIKIEDGVIERLKSFQLQSGSLSDVDVAFRQFAIARPIVVRGQIVDKRGNIKRQAFELGQTTATTMTGMLYEHLEADIAAGTADKVIEEMFQWPHLRELITRATNYYRHQVRHGELMRFLLGLWRSSRSWLRRF
jgi:hypothetical protein